MTKEIYNESIILHDYFVNIIDADRDSNHHFNEIITVKHGTNFGKISHSIYDIPSSSLNYELYHDRPRELYYDVYFNISFDYEIIINVGIKIFNISIRFVKRDMSDTYSTNNNEECIIYNIHSRTFNNNQNLFCNENDNHYIRFIENITNIFELFYNIKRVDEYSCIQACNRTKFALNYIPDYDLYQNSAICEEAIKKRTNEYILFLVTIKKDKPTSSH